MKRVLGVVLGGFAVGILLILAGSAVHRSRPVLPVLSAPSPSPSPTCRLVCSDGSCYADPTFGIEPYP